MRAGLGRPRQGRRDRAGPRRPAPLAHLPGATRLRAGLGPVGRGAGAPAGSDLNRHDQPRPAPGPPSSSRTASSKTGAGTLTGSWNRIDEPEGFNNPDHAARRYSWIKPVGIGNPDSIMRRRRG